MKVKNVQGFQVGDVLVSDTHSASVLAIQDDSLSLSRRVTRCQASNLTKTFQTAHPDAGVPHFLAQWTQYWKRQETPEDHDVQAILEYLPQVHQAALPPLSLEDWRCALRSANPKTMRGTDSWTVRELRLLPDAFAQVLLDLMMGFGRLCSWPEQLTKWLLILLRKQGSGTPSWDLL